jgi:hypothetical protein
MLRRFAYAPQASLKSRNHDAPNFLHCLGYYSSATTTAASRVVNQKKIKKKNRENLGLMLRRFAYAPQASLKSRNHDAPDFLHTIESSYIAWDIIHLLLLLLLVE